MNENQRMKNIVLISVLNGATYEYEPIAAGETAELAVEALEHEKSKFKGLPLIFEMTQQTLIRFNALIALK